MFRPRRLVWLLGLALLVGTAAGAGWILNHSEAGDRSPPRTGETPDPGGVICIGYVDVGPGVANLYPLQPGRVVWVWDEDAAKSHRVDKGTVLLRLDDAAQQAELRRAELALKAARKRLEEAELLPGQQEDLVAQLRAAVEAAEGDKASAEAQLARARNLAKGGNGPVEAQRAAEGQVRKAAGVVKAAKAKLKAAEDQRPRARLAVDLANLDVAEKTALVEKARVARDECRVTAPENGTVLRVLVSKGDFLGPVPRGPAIEFCPDGPRVVRAEVRQEWAARVKVGQKAVVEDDAATGLRWPGRVKRISDWYTHRRTIIQEPFQFNDVRTLECLVEITGSGPEPLRMNQRVRVLIK
jgi:multidrug resistance efflux pump